MHSATVIIPARMGSTRFPGKVLADRTGRPLIQHVHEAATRARCASRLVVAADDPRVIQAARSFGAEAVLTDASHPNGTSRLAQAAALLDLAPDHIVVNLQGDEPEIDPALIDAAVDALVSSGAPVATVGSPFRPGQSPDDPNIVKVVVSSRGLALYFSRSRIPFNRDRAPSPAAAPLKHVGLYVYRRSFLDQYVRLPETPLEATEKLEQLRILEHGMAIAVAVREAHHVGIDTPEQYDAFVERWRARAGD